VTDGWPVYRAGTVETASREALRSHQEAKLAPLVTWLAERCPYWRRQFSALGIGPGDVRTLDDLAGLPYLTKAACAAGMDAHPPYGEFLCHPVEEIHRMGAVLFRTTGTTGKQRWFINTHEGFHHFGEQGARVLWQAGVRPGDTLLGIFPLSLWTAGWGLHDGCRSARITFVPGGPPFDTSARLDLIRDYRPAAVACTPSYALTLARAASGRGLDLSACGVRALLIGGEPFPESRRRRIEELWNLPGGTRNFAGITEGGPIYLGAECEAQAGMHLFEDSVVFEIVHAGGRQPVGPGELGELVFTSLDQRVMGTSFHYRTGDLVRYTDEPCACGRTLRRIAGIEGRVDDMVKVRGVNVFASAIEDLIRSVPGLADDFLLILERPSDADEVTVEVEPAPGVDAAAHEGLRRALEAALQRALGIRIPARIVPPDSLPRFELKARRWVDRRPRD
jgi:phenylacetate-CoA ligase